MLAAAKPFRLLGVMTLGAVLTGPGRAYAQGPQPASPADVHEHVSVTAQLLTPTRETSGTAWLPQATPMYGAHQTWRGWDVRLNGAAMPAHHLHAHEYARSVLAVGKLQVGYVRHRRATNGLVPGIGGTVSISVLGPDLAPRYAGRVAPGFAVFLSLRPSRHAM